MPKLPPDEKLFTPEQLADLQNPCGNCGCLYGHHKFEGKNCPNVPPGKSRDGWLSTTFVGARVEPVSLSTSRPLVEGGRVVGVDIRAFGVGSEVRFGDARALKTGKVVEVVPAGKLPTTPGLRHIADKRRTPKTRDVVSYVVEISESTARNDLSRVVPKRDRLFWPNTFGVAAV